MTTSNANIGAARSSLDRLVRRLCRETKSNAWAVWCGICFEAAGWHFWTWQFHGALIPLCILVFVAREQPPNEY